MNAAVQNAFNEQIKHELFSGYLYLSMSAHFDHENFPGFAHWMRLQAQEELAHAIRLLTTCSGGEGGSNSTASRRPRPISDHRSPSSKVCWNMSGR